MKTQTTCQNKPINLTADQVRALMSEIRSVDLPASLAKKAKIGDRLWVREPWAIVSRVLIFAGDLLPHERLPEIHPASAMPRRFSRHWMVVQKKGKCVLAASFGGGGAK